MIGLSKTMDEILRDFADVVEGDAKLRQFTPGPNACELWWHVQATYRKNKSLLAAVRRVILDGLLDHVAHDATACMIEELRMLAKYHDKVPDWVLKINLGYVYLALRAAGTMLLKPADRSKVVDVLQAMGWWDQCTAFIDPTSIVVQNEGVQGWCDRALHCRRACAERYRAAIAHAGSSCVAPGGLLYDLRRSLTVLEDEANDHLDPSFHMCYDVTPIYDLAARVAVCIDIGGCHSIKVYASSIETSPVEHKYVVRLPITETPPLGFCVNLLDASPARICVKDVAGRVLLNARPKDDEDDDWIMPFGASTIEVIEVVAV